MGTIKFITYSMSDDLAVSRTNDYISDGHGASVLRTNEYISDGHGQASACIAWHCPRDPQLATTRMEVLRMKYLRQHPGRETGQAAQKSSVIHVQIILSFADDEVVSVDEMLEIVDQWWEDTGLSKDFAARAEVHLNTDVRHVHLSVCPYSLDGTHKLPLDLASRQSMQREFDYICEAHQLSIVDNPSLRNTAAGAEYKAWFDQTAAEGKITIHPAKKRKKEKGRTAHNQAKAEAVQRKEWEKAFQREQRRAQKDGDGYSVSYIRFPNDDTRAFMIPSFSDDGHAYSDLDLRLRLQQRWATSASRKVKRTGQDSLLRKLDRARDEAYAAIEYMRQLDIHNMDELIMHRNQCGRELAEIRKKIEYEDAILNDPTADEARKARARAAKKKLQEMEQKKQQEYRQVQMISKVARHTENSEAWREYTLSMARNAIIDQALAADRRAAEEQFWKEYKVLKERIRVEQDRFYEDRHTSTVSKPYRAIDDYISQRHIFDYGAMEQYIRDTYNTEKITSTKKYLHQLREQHNRAMKQCYAYDRRAENYAHTAKKEQRRSVSAMRHAARALGLAAEDIDRIAEGLKRTQAAEAPELRQLAYSAKCLSQTLDTERIQQRIEYAHESVMEKKLARRLANRSDPEELTDSEAQAWYQAICEEQQALQEEAWEIEQLWDERQAREAASKEAIVSESEGPSFDALLGSAMRRAAVQPSNRAQPPRRDLGR